LTTRFPSAASAVDATTGREAPPAARARRDRARWAVTASDATPAAPSSDESPRQPRALTVVAQSGCVEWFGNGLQFARLNGHAKAITGVAQPDGSDKLFSGSLDGTELRLHGTALLAEDDGAHLFAGTEDGVIYMWRMNQSGQHCFDEVAVLASHATTAVVSLAQGKCTLYSGYADGSIRAWDVAGRRSYDDDGTVKVWRAKPDRDELDLEVHYVHSEGERVVAIGGTYDPDKKPVLMVPRGDGTVRVYDLPSLKKRGQTGCNGEARAISVRSPGVIFTGDIRVVKWATRDEAEV
ncbi:hypothetical protein EJB05_08029, partial [Eragrostis curvula]